MRAALASAFVFACLVIFSLSIISQPAPLAVVSKDGRRTLATTTQNEQDFVALDDLAAMFQLAVREDALGVTVSYKTKTIVLTLDQPLASVSGRLISLPAPPVRGPAPARRWLVPVEFISRALALIYDVKLDLRRPSRLLIVGDIRAPRVQMRSETVGTGVRLTIDALPGAGSAVSQDNERITIKFDADLVDLPNGLALTPQAAAQGVVRGVRLADATTIAVDLGARFGAMKASLQTLDNSSRLVVDVSSSAAPAPPPPAQTDAAPSPSPGAPGAPVLPGPPPDLAALAQPPISIRTIVIDPGHGGDDEGVRGPGGTKEKDLTLVIARRMKAAIESRLGIRVLLTRDEDRRVPIDDRTALANNNKSDLFISLHANGSWRQALSGGSIYSVAFEAGAAQSARSLAPERVPAIGGGTREIEFVPWDFAQTAHTDESDTLAKLLEAQFHNRIPLAARAVDSAPLRVLESANMPAVLIEMGYLTNPQQETQLAGADFQNPFVQGVLDAIVRFRDLLDEKRHPAQSAPGGTAR